MLISFLAQPPVVVAILQIFIGCMLVVATMFLCLVIVRSSSLLFGASGKAEFRNCGISYISFLFFLYKSASCYDMYFKNCPTFVTIQVMVKFGSNSILCVGLFKCYNLRTFLILFVFLIL